MCFCIKEMDTGETYIAKDEKSGADIVRHLASTLDEAVDNLMITGSAAPMEYEFLKKCFEKEK